MNGRVHGIGTDGTLEQFMDAGGRSGVGSGTRRAGVRRRDAIIGSSLRRRKLRVVSVDDMVRVRVHRIIVDLVFVQSIRRGNAFNAIQIHTKILDRQKPLKKKKMTRRVSLLDYSFPSNQNWGSFFSFSLSLYRFGFEFPISDSREPDNLYSSSPPCHDEKQVLFLSSFFLSPEREREEGERVIRIAVDISKQKQVGLRSDGLLLLLLILLYFLFFISAWPCFCFSFEMELFLLAGN